MHLRFEERETTLGYLKALKAYEEHYGLPLAFYSDKLSVFRVNNPEAKTEGETQFGRVCRELGIALPDFRTFERQTSVQANTRKGC